MDIPSDAPPFPLALGAAAPLRNKKAMGCAIGEKAPTAGLARKLASEALGLLAKFGSSQRTPSELDGLLKSQLSWRFATAGFLAYRAECQARRDPWFFREAKNCRI